MVPQRWSEIPRRGRGREIFEVSPSRRLHPPSKRIRLLVGMPWKVLMPLMMRMRSWRYMASWRRTLVPTLEKETVLKGAKIASCNSECSGREIRRAYFTISAKVRGKSFKPASFSERILIVKVNVAFSLLDNKAVYGKWQFDLRMLPITIWGILFAWKMLLLRAPFKLMTYLLLQEPNNVITWTCSCWQFVLGYLKYFSLSLKKTIFFILLLVIFLICNSLEFYAFFEHIFWNVRFSLEVKRIALAGSSHIWRFLRC